MLDLIPSPKSLIHFTDKNSSLYMVWLFLCLFNQSVDHSIGKKPKVGTSTEQYYLETRSFFTLPIPKEHSKLTLSFDRDVF